MPILSGNFGASGKFSASYLLLRMRFQPVSTLNLAVKSQVRRNQAGKMRYQHQETDGYQKSK